MKILLTNDDGIQVGAMKNLADALASEHEICVVAPDGNRSGQSMAITLHEHLKVKEIHPNWFQCSGSPVDCVLLVTQGQIWDTPDLIISGINYGPNLGTDLLYSGTAAAARQGALKGIPSIAASLNEMKGPWHFDEAIRFISDHLDFLMSLCGKKHFLNLNFPSKMKKDRKLRFTTPCHRKYMDSYESFDPPKGNLRYYFPHGYMDLDNPQAGSDLEAVLQGDIAVTPIAADPIALPDSDGIKEKVHSWEG